MKLNTKILAIVLIAAMPVFLSCGANHSGDICALTVSVTGQGGVDGPGSFCTGTCTYYLDKGSVILMTASPAFGYAFSKWTGSFSGTVPAVVFTVNGNMQATAVFVKIASSESRSEEDNTKGNECPDGSIAASALKCISVKGDTVSSYDLLSGSIIWNYHTESEILYGPVLTLEGVIYIGTEDGSVYEINADTGRVIIAGDINKN